MFSFVISLIEFLPDMIEFRCSSSNNSFIRRSFFCHNFIPVRSSNGVNLVLLDIVLFMTCCTDATYLYHFLGSSLLSFAKIGIRILCILSTCPFPLSTPVVIGTCSIFCSLQYVSKLSDVNAGSLSVIICGEFLKMFYCSFSLSITSMAAVVLTGYNQTNLVKVSMTVIMRL